MNSAEKRLEDKVLNFLEKDIHFSSKNEIDLTRKIQISDMMYNQHRKETYFTTIALISLQCINLIVTLILNNTLISTYSTFINIAICVIVCIHTNHNSKVWKEYSNKYRRLENILKEKEEEMNNEK